MSGSEDYPGETTTTLCYHGYCDRKEKEPYMLQCQTCKRLFHLNCLKSGNPTPLHGDVFFNFTCINCSDHGEEECTRAKLQWFQVVMLALYNLQLTGKGKCGYFRWKEHICAFIDKHWTTLFGFSRKKTSTWYGTVAGTLSAGCPQYFSSGAKELKEAGWWSLVEARPPSIDTMNVNRPVMKKVKLEPSPEPQVKLEGLRTRRSKTSFEAAMELKAKRSTTQEAKDIRRKRASTAVSPVSSQGDLSQSAFSNSSTGSQSPSSASSAGTSHPLLLTPSQIKTEPIDDGPDDSLGASNLSKTIVSTSLVDEDSTTSFSSIKSDQWLTERDLRPAEMVPQLLLAHDEEDEDDSDFEVDPCSITPPNFPSSPVPPGEPLDNLPRMEEIMSSMDYQNEDSVLSEAMSMKTNDSQAMETDSCTDARDAGSESEGESEVESDSGSNSETEVKSDDDKQSWTTPSSDVTADVAKRRKVEGNTHFDRVPDPRYVPISLYEEKHMLKKMQSYGAVLDKDPSASRLKRQLIVRQLKRARGLPVFNIDSEVIKLLNTRKDGSGSKERRDYDTSLNCYNAPIRYRPGDQRVLDRFQSSLYQSSPHTQRSVLFLNRLVGTEDDQLQSIHSPYTARVLKPFIHRDYETRPAKMKLLQEIRAHPHRKDGEWVARHPGSIDYCYVRPQHIPSVNSLCREFFWPGIELSECLQYPDFSCIALYRKLVIGFSFMVPDVKYNEAYISFIFTHPEWRGAGIGTFMLYHLIQTCMGKDVTLHVSATNSAMLLYQKFGFKPEEFILNFYDKYYPEDSRECKHAFFLRLRR